MAQSFDGFIPPATLGRRVLFRGVTEAIRAAGE
jgi:hypothetical protein